MLKLRPYEQTDVRTILSWSKDEVAFYKWTAGVLGDWPLTEEQFGQVSNLIPFTAVEDDEIVGFFTLRKPGETMDLLRFGFVVVDPEKRGCGYGKRMLLLGIEEARKLGAKKVSLGVFENNPPAYHCYKAAGFQDVPLPEPEYYHVFGQEWNCLEMDQDIG